MNKNEILIDLSESKRTKFGKEDFALQSLPQKVFSAIWDVEAQVNNGGFSQYFLNWSSKSAAFVVNALEAIGAQAAAAVCSRAISVAYPGGLPHDAEVIRSTASEFSDEILHRLAWIIR